MVNIDEKIQNFKKQARQQANTIIEKVTPGSDRDIRNWEKRLKDQTLRGWNNYKRFRYELTTARANDYLGLTGEFLFVEAVSSKSALAMVRLNRNTNDPIDLKIGTHIKTIFESLYVTNTAQSGEWIDLVVGINFEYGRQQVGNQAEAQACIILTNAGVGNVQAAAHICNKVLIRAHTGNAGTIWIDFGTAGVVNSGYELTAGDAISVNCSNTNRIQGWFTNGGDRATIVYEV